MPLEWRIWFRIWVSSEWGSSGMPGEAEDLGWIQGLVDVSGKALGRSDTCHHHGRDQILTTTIIHMRIHYKLEDSVY